MAEEPIHENLSGATKAMVGTVGFLLLMFGGETMLDRQPRYSLGICLCVSGIILFYIGVIGKGIRRRIPDSAIRSLNQVAVNPAWWLAVLLTFIMSISLWRASTVLLSIPTVPTADDIAKAVVRNLPAAQSAAPGATVPKAEYEAAQQQIARQPAKGATPSVPRQAAATVSDYDRDQMKREIDDMIKITREKQFQDSINSSVELLHTLTGGFAPPAKFSKFDIMNKIIDVDSQIKSAHELFLPILNQFPQYDTIKNIVDQKCNGGNGIDDHLLRFRMYIFHLHTDPTTNPDVWDMFINTKSASDAVSWLTCYSQWGKSLADTLISTRRKL